MVGNCDSISRLKLTISVFAGELRKQGARRAEERAREGAPVRGVLRDAQLRVREVSFLFHFVFLMIVSKLFGY